MDRMDEAIFEFAYRMALDDATGQRAYISHGEGSKTKLREWSEPKQIVKEYIEAIFDSDSQPEIDKTIAGVEEAFKQHLNGEDGGDFTFGNAQKLVNMTAKYMFMATYKEPELRRQFEKCHCPMDSIIVAEVIKQIKKNMPAEGPLVEKLQKKYECRDKKLSKWTVYLKQTWSSMTEDDRGQYDLFQELVRYLCGVGGSKLTPIEYDFKNWQ